MKRSKPRSIWLWQPIVSPHMAGLATALATRGHDVAYVAEQIMTPDRALQGWSPPPMHDVRLEVASTFASVDSLVTAAPVDSIHFCGGIRGNGLIARCQADLARRYASQWIVMEKVDDAGLVGAVKRLEYRRLLMYWRRRVQGMLAIGHSTSNWVVTRGMPANKVFPFAYFLPDTEPVLPKALKRSGPFRFLFVGQFIERKRLDFLIEAFRRMPTSNFELAVVGSGALEARIRALAMEVLAGRLDWIGRLPFEAVTTEMDNANCLVLPSRHDGWGAVVSEALMAGTPVVCSDACGAADVVRASGYGSVFATDDLEALVASLVQVIAKGQLLAIEKTELANWAKCLGADAGADYLLAIIDHREGHTQRPLPPWQTTVQDKSIRSIDAR